MTDDLRVRVLELEEQVAALREENQALRADKARLEDKNARMERSFGDLLSKFASRGPGDASPGSSSGSASSAASTPGLSVPLAGRFHRSPRDALRGDGTRTLPSSLKQKRLSGVASTASLSGEHTPTEEPSGTRSVDLSGRSSASMRRRAQTLDARSASMPKNIMSTFVSPRNPERGTAGRAWGVALRDHFESGVTVPGPVSQLVSLIKQTMEDSNEPLFSGDTEAEEDPTLKTILESGESIPQGSERSAARLLLNYLWSLPDALIGPETVALLSEAYGMVNAPVEYQKAAVRHVIQASLPYNHRVLLQLLMSLLNRAVDAERPVVTERVSAAIFQVDPANVEESARMLRMLKDLRRAGSEAFPTSCESVQYMVDKSHLGRLMIRSATKETLLGAVTHRFMQEPRTLHSLLALLDRWSSSDELLDVLTKQHASFVNHLEASKASDTAEPGALKWAEDGRDHILQLTKTWMELSPEILVHAETWARMRLLARQWQRAVTSGNADKERKLRKWLKSRQRKVEAAAAASSAERAKVLALEETSGAGGNHPASVSLPSWPELMHETDAVRMAEQIAVADALLFQGVTKADLRKLGFEAANGKEGDSGHGAWAGLVRRFNCLSSWVVTAVLTPALPSQRAEVIVWFLRVADHLQTVLCDLHGAYAIVSGLSDPAVERLKATWTRLTREWTDQWAQLQLLWSVDHNFARYRTELARACSLPPAVPYCGLLAKDMFAVEQNNGADLLERDLVNVDKLRLLWERMESFLTLQPHAEYGRLEPDWSLQAFLAALGRPHGMELLDAARYRSVSISLEKRSHSHTASQEGGDGAGASLAASLSSSRKSPK